MYHSEKGLQPIFLKTCITCQNPWNCSANSLFFSELHVHTSWLVQLLEGEVANNCSVIDQCWPQWQCCFFYACACVRMCEGEVVYKPSELFYLSSLSAVWDVRHKNRASLMTSVLNQTKFWQLTHSMDSDPHSTLQQQSRHPGTSSGHILWCPWGMISCSHQNDAQNWRCGGT